MKPPNKKPKPAKYTAKTYSEIIRLARLLRQILKIDHRFAPNLLEIFDQLKRFFPKLRLKIVPDFLLPDAEARAYPKHWLIKIRQGIYDGLLRGDARARWTLAHELGHILLQHPRRPFRVRDTNSARPIDPRLEREANIFAREFLVPAHLARNYKTIEELRACPQLSQMTIAAR